MSVKKVNVELENLTPELAKSFANMAHLPGERPLKPLRLKFFENHIKSGTFLDPSWSVAIKKDTGEKFRIDGQHTSTALAATPAELFPKDKLATIVTYEFDNINADGTTLFDMFDNPHSVRNNEDMMGVFKSAYPELVDLSNKLLVQIAGGIAAYESEKDGGFVIPSRHRGIYFDDKERAGFALWIQRFLDDPHLLNNWMIGKPGIVAEMYADRLADEELATKYWSYVLKQNHPDSDHPTQELVEDLQKWHQRQERKSQQAYRNRAHKAWMKFRKEAEFEVMKAEKLHQPEIFENQPSA